MQSSSKIDKRYQKGFQAFWMTMDHKPGKKSRRHIEKKNRQRRKTECRKAALVDT